MRTQLIGRSPLVATRLSYGCWRLVSTMNPAEVTPDREAEGRRAVIAAYEAGYTLFDHADIYCAGVCEKVFGDVLRQVAGMRDRVLIATKCGIILPAPGVQHRYDFSRDHILRSCEQSLQRLGVDTIDLYQLHRPDLLMNPAEVAGAFNTLRQQGKVGEFGVSNFSPSFVTALQSACPFPLAVNQVEVHLARLDCFYDGTLDQCLAQKITPMAWSPLGGGVLGDGGTVEASNPKAAVLSKLQHVMDEVAGKYGISRSVLAVAWLLKHPSGIVPIIGTIKPQRIAEMVKADDVELSREDWYKLLVAARGEALP
ncbi:aldo/keto reductase [Humisphaera borealis]|uniref:Aldo/keto reductase n=1 Tax=Humisphaera borealis TaxID=2807512 RepID=A0A7M2X2Y1_9BACT|nr:aldo/keto reductase [Humisphaera borealis]QOV92073.1 aldo/keto reductase [Humisphaera borealis]